MAKRKTIYKERELAEWKPFFELRDDIQVPGARIFQNSRYIVFLRSYKATKTKTDDLLHLSIKHLDGRPDIPYEDVMRIKREILGPEYDLIQRYPAESEEVNTANVYHFWGRNNASWRWPVGWSYRAVSKRNGNTVERDESEMSPDFEIDVREAAYRELKS